ncbi:MAG: hypothetical protein AB7E72_20850 [Lysobacterales bacterium]
MLEDERFVLRNVISYEVGDDLETIEANCADAAKMAVLDVMKSAGNVTFQLVHRATDQDIQVDFDAGSVGFLITAGVCWDIEDCARQIMIWASDDFEADALKFEILQ